VVKRNRGKLGPCPRPNDELCASTKGMEDGKLATHLLVKVTSMAFVGLTNQEVGMVATLLYITIALRAKVSI